MTILLGGLHVDMPDSRAGVSLKPFEPVTAERTMRSHNR
jgi:hypothetical protein